MGNFVKDSPEQPIESFQLKTLRYESMRGASMEIFLVVKACSHDAIVTAIFLIASVEVFLKWDENLANSRNLMNH